MSDLESVAFIVIQFRNHLNLNTPGETEIRQGIIRLIGDNKSDFLVAINNNSDFIAYALLRYRYSMWFNGYDSTIEDLYVIPEERGKGIGKDMLNYAIDQATSRKCKAMCLNTNENNTISNRLYESQGFITRSKQWNNGCQLFFRKTFK